MDMQGSRVLAATQQEAWKALNDPVVLKACIPGCDKFEPSGANQYAVGLSVKIGPVSAKFAGRVTLSDIDPPNSYTIAFDGQGGAAGFGKGAAEVMLVPQGTGCEIGYTVKAQVGGKIAQLGQRLIDGVARAMAEDFFKRFDDEMQRRHPTSAMDFIAGREPPVRATGQNGLANVPWWVWVGGAVVLLAAFWLLR
jgi:carbon monoxide dehydrogenase subunit G